MNNPFKVFAALLVLLVFVIGIYHLNDWLLHNHPDSLTALGFLCLAWCGGLLAGKLLKAILE